MSQYATLKAAIAAAIKENGNKEITGNLLQQQLLAMVNSLGNGYQYAGIATPATNPGTPDQNVFYFAFEPGTYANFSGVVVGDNEVAILKWNGAWTKETTGVATTVFVKQVVKNISKAFSYYNNQFGKLDWGVGYWRKSDKVLNAQSGWSEILYVIPDDVKIVVLNLDCSGGATGSWLEDENGNTIKAWASEFINEIIDLSEYPTAHQLRLCCRDSYENSICFINDGSFVDEWLKVYKNQLGYQKTDWVDGSYYDSNGELVTQSATYWKSMQVDILPEIQSIKLVNIDSTANAPYSLLIANNGTILESWNNTTINTEIILSNYPTASKLLISCRNTSTNDSVILQYPDKTFAEFLNDIYTKFVGVNSRFGSNEQAIELNKKLLSIEYGDNGNWLDNVYINDNKTFGGNSNWKVGFFAIPIDAKYLSLNFDCSGGATCAFLEDADGNTLKMWKGVIVNELIKLSDYPTATILRASYKKDYDGYISIINNNAIANDKENLLYSPINVAWESGYYDSNKAKTSNAYWECAKVWLSNIARIRINVDCSGASAYCYLLDESQELVKLWNNAKFDEIVNLADYPTARILLLSNRVEHTDRYISAMYGKNVSQITKELDDTVTNYKMRSIIPVKIKSTDNVLFVGDSICYGQGAGSSANRWVDRVCAAIGCTFTNDSEPGAAFSEGRIISHINNKDLTQFSYIVIAAGINDCNRGYTKTQIQNAVGAICDYINAYTGFTGKVLFVTPANEYRPKDTRAIYSVEQVRRIIYDKVASYGNFYLLDGGGIPFSNIIGDATNALLVTYQSDGVTFDGLHPNSNGHLMYANYFLTNCANL